MRSMTGYGAGRKQADGREMTIEIKAVNHRFLDINLRMPRGLLFLEDPIRKALSASLSRGHLDIYVNYRNSREDARQVRVDAQLLSAYQTALDALLDAVPVTDDRSLMRMATLPDVLSLSEREEDQQAVTSLAMEALREAIAALLLMRSAEGQALQADLSQRTDALEAITADIAARAPLVVEEYRERLLQRISELLDAPPDPQRLAQEVAIMADRAAIDEELVRLTSHIGQIRDAAHSDEPIGRKLDFIVQEMGREVNTIGSKSSDLTICDKVVLAKAEIEKIREQVQNIE